MLADNADIPPQIGALSSDVQKPATFRIELLDFIADELPRWRDDADRQSATSEPLLTAQLCAYLNDAARHSDGWDILQFRREEPDERNTGRAIDLVPAPCGIAISIDGQRYTKYKSLMPIECKRLPTPTGKDRDVREYVISQFSTTGGIQRFKEGHHGAEHTLGAMIGYIQEETTAVWDERIAVWIDDLADSTAGWSKKDLLHFMTTDAKLKTARLESSHERKDSLSEIQIHHLWIEMS